MTRPDGDCIKLPPWVFKPLNNSRKVMSPSISSASMTMTELMPLCTTHHCNRIGNNQFRADGKKITFRRLPGFILAEVGDSGGTHGRVPKISTESAFQTNRGTPVLCAGIVRGTGRPVAAINFT